jgi:hypothetical protein
MGWAIVDRGVDESMHQVYVKGLHSNEASKARSMGRSDALLACG